MEIVEATIRDEFLADKAVDERQRANENADNVLASCQGNEQEGLASELDYKKLAEKNADDDADEQVVIPNFFENVELLLFQLTGVEEIENL